jgi:serine/threonine-protein kinase
VARTFEESWREITSYLDTVLELEPEARRAWVEALELREPAVAAQVRSYVLELAELQEQCFLEAAVDSFIGPATLEGQRFGAYTIDQALGHGGMGSVWLAHRSDGRFEGQAAVKLLNAALVGHPSALRFAREGSVLAKLQHPNIAHLLDAGVATSSQPYLVLEYVRGDRIDEYCEQHGLSIERRITLFLDVLAAVAHAHSHLIVHRDLKPSNILVTDDGVVKLLDFGVAALLSPDAEGVTHLTRGMAAGLTPAYAAPEQLLGDSVTTATDVYALGLVLFVLLAGRHPASPEGKTSEEVIRLTLEQEAPRPSEIATEIGQRRLLRGDLDNIIGMALRRSSTERYTTVELFAQDLRRYLALEPVSAQPRSLGYLAVMFVRRHRAAVATAIAIVAVLLSAVIITTTQLLETRVQRDRARFQSRRAEASNDFLGQLLLSDLGPSDPMSNNRGRIERGVEMLDKEYASDPKFQGRMLVYMGDAFVQTNQTARADELFQRGYEIGRDHNDPELMVHAKCERAYADALSGIREEPAQRLAEARQLLTRIDHPDADLQADCLVADAMVEKTLGHSSAAEGLLQQGLRVVEADGSTYRPVYVQILAQLGVLYQSRNQLREMLRVMQLAGELLDRNGRSSTSERLIIRNNVAAALNAMGEIRAALAECEFINQHLAEVGGSAQIPGNIPVNYAAALARMGRLVEALKAVDGVLDRLRSAGNSNALMRGLFTKGSILAQMEHWDEADLMLQEAVSRASSGGTNPTTDALIESSLMQLDLARGNLESAHRHRDRSLALAGYHTPSPQRSLGRVLLMAAQGALAEHAASDAEKFARDALAIHEAVARGPDTSADVGEALLRLAQARISAGSTAGNRSMLELAVRCLTNGLAPNHPLTIEARTLLAGSA